MENRKNLKNRLEELRKKRKQYKFIDRKLLDNPLLLTEEERVRFIEHNKEIIAELKKITDEISDIRWKLMTPEQQQKYIDKYKEV